MPGVARLGDTITHGGAITGASPDTSANGIRVARLGDTVECDVHGEQTITSASTTVKANGKGVARLGDSVSCGATISSASDDVSAGD